MPRMADAAVQYLPCPWQVRRSRPFRTRRAPRRAPWRAAEWLIGDARHRSQEHPVADVDVPYPQRLGKFCQFTHAQKPGNEFSCTFLTRFSGRRNPQLPEHCVVILISLAKIGGYALYACRMPDTSNLNDERCRGAVVIVAAGRGERAGSIDGPKQYRTVGGTANHQAHVGSISRPSRDWQGRCRHSSRRPRTLCRSGRRAARARDSGEWRCVAARCRCASVSRHWCNMRRERFSFRTLPDHSSRPN